MSEQPAYTGDVSESLRFVSKWLNEETQTIPKADIAILCAALQSAEAQPAQAVALRMSDEMRDFIEGMSVSVDVSTCEDDAQHRYFGTVSEVMDDPLDKHGVTLLVQNAKPNFKAAESAAVRELVEALREIDFALRFYEESPSSTGQIQMMHHPLTVREFIHSLITKYKE